MALEATGKGIYVGIVLNVDNFNVSNQQHPWFVEGDDMIFIDGESWPPSIHGTGLEDYFHSAWCFPTGNMNLPTMARLLPAIRRSTSENGAFTASMWRNRSISRNPSA